MTPKAFKSLKRTPLSQILIVLPLGVFVFQFTVCPFLNPQIVSATPSPEDPPPLDALIASPTTAKNTSVSSEGLAGSAGTASAECTGAQAGTGGTGQPQSMNQEECNSLFSGDGTPFSESRDDGSQPKSNCAFKKPVKSSEIKQVTSVDRSSSSSAPTAANGTSDKSSQVCAALI